VLRKFVAPEQRDQHAKGVRYPENAAVMKEIQDILQTFAQRRAEPFALATLVRARGSSYRRPGARMLIASDRSTVGALSGGCLEEVVAARAQGVIATGTAILHRFDTRLRYGCNGAIDIFVEKLEPILLDQLAAAQRERRVSWIATMFENSDSLGSRFLAAPADVPATAFGQMIPPPLQLVLIGEGPDSPPLRDLAGLLGWRVIEADEAGALPNDFDEWTAVVVKTHNYGRDYAALEKLLPLGLPYVALLGPRRRRDQLLHTLLETGLTARSELFSPAGLDLGAESPEEIGLAIIAEIQSVFARSNVESLRARKQPIHEVVAAV
jgi:xanthine/CO dehydrogenase XdhC/CoxF family maturation factor